jgi:hypothetical protein
MLDWRDDSVEIAREEIGFHFLLRIALKFPYSLGTMCFHYKQVISRRAYIRYDYEVIIRLRSVENPLENETPSLKFT